ncbi:ATP-grasp domain-containing protein [Streptomyces sp. MST-110588]|uniref:carboxylate--amine ligase n=1 Tax=Streptomyces sp. MST-110588 TaxID=2833628 RepID=UPI001F5DC379|nr:ATP-grasp domain-containing protein [Streptomyces sp. MST-110588]
MNSFDTDVPALLLRLDPNPFHHGTLGALRSLGRTGIEVHAVVDAAGGPAGRSRYLHRAHPPPPRGASDADILTTLCRVSERIGRRAVLIPLDDRSAISVAALSGRLARRFLLPSVAPSLPGRVADKAELARICSGLEVPHPRTVAPGSAAEAAGKAAELGFPVVAKWSRPWVLPPGLRSTALVRTPEEARTLYGHSARAGSELLLQRHLPGGQGTDWFFHGYTAGHGTFLMGGAGRKERSWPLRTGLTAVGTWLPNPEVEEAASRIAARVDYRGILDLDFRFDADTGRYHLLDFNPRPGAQFRLFTDADGLDVVRAQHLHLTGRGVPEPRSAPGRVFVAENYALLSTLLSKTPAGRRPPYVLPASSSPPTPAAKPAVAAPPVAAPPEVAPSEAAPPDEVPSCAVSPAVPPPHAASPAAGSPRTTPSDAGPPDAAAPAATPPATVPSESLSPGPARRRVRRDVEYAWFALDDPLPFLAMAAAWLARCVHKAWHRLFPAAKPRLGPRRPTGTVQPSPRPDGAGAEPAGRKAPPPPTCGPRSTAHSDQKEGNACTTS